jgi:uncharacterized membrane protein
MQKPTWLRQNFLFAIILVVAIGVSFRFANLDRKVYWGDEVYTSLRILGYGTTEMQQAIAGGKPVPAAALQKFQAQTPENGIAASVQALVKEDSHLTPLYFVLARMWVNLFGTSSTAIRSLSVLFSVLALPVTYWLAMELFGSVTIAWITVTLAAISPVQMVFAQEARFYSLWILTTTLSSATLLRAMRIGTVGSWTGFAIALALNLYTQFLAVLTLGGYAIYVLISTWQRDWKTLRQFMLATTLASMTLLPWIWVFVTRVQDSGADDTASRSQSLFKAIKNLFVVFSRAFVDFNWNGNSPKIALALLGIFTLTCLVIAIAATRKLVQETQMRSWLFVFALSLSSLLPMMPRTLRDTLPSRYLLPTYLGLQLIIAYLLGSSLQSPKACRPRWLWSGATVFLVSLGLLSCGSIARADTWWIKQFSTCNMDVAQVVNNSPKPLVITDGDGVRTFDHALSNAVSLGRLVKAETQFQIFLENQLPDIIPVATGFTDRYLFSPSKTLLDRMEHQYPDMKPEIDGSDNGYRTGSKYCLWRLPKNEG